MTVASQPANGDVVRVLVVEDSRTARALLVGILASDPGLRVVGEAASGAEAVEMAIRLRPDLITMDVHMPGGDGIEATRAIMARAPTPIVIVSALAPDDVALSLDATRAGALLVLRKPASPRAADFDAQCAQLVAMVKAMAQVKVVRRWGGGRGGGAASGDERAATPRPPARPTQPATVVAIGASTGGPAALRDILAGLPSRFAAPVLVVQHISRGFVGGLARWLQGETALQVVVAGHGAPVRAGTVYLAPDDHHLELRADRGGLRTALVDAPPDGSFRPSASRLFASAARAAGPQLLTCILTGMGDDGVDGLREARQLGARVLAQDEATSVIYGMPREAVRAGVVDEVVPLERIADRLLDLTAGRAAGAPEER